MASERSKLGERRATLLSIGPKATLRQVNIDELENPIVIPQKSTKVITAKIIEVKPYEWIEIIDKGKRQIEEEFFKNAESGDRTRKTPFLQGSSTLKSHLFQLWSGLPGLNWRPHVPQTCALPLRQAPIYSDALPFDFSIIEGFCDKIDVWQARKIFRKKLW